MLIEIILFTTLNNIFAVFVNAVPKSSKINIGLEFCKYYHVYMLKTNVKKVVQAVCILPAKNW